MKRITPFILLFCFMLLNSSLFQAHASDDLRSAVKKVKSGIVSIITRTEGSASEGGGSGIIISSDGYILTNSHVIRGARTIQVKLADERVYSGYIIRAAADRDLAVIRINCTGLTVPHFGDSSALELGQTVFAIGSPMKFSGSITRGIVSALDRDIETNGVLYRDLIQTDAAINPGSSGGALCNDKGEVVGINTLKFAGTSEYRYTVGIGFAIPINAAMKIARALVKGTAIVTPRPWIGITAETLLKETAEAYNIHVKYGVLVTKVEPGGPCAKAGIVSGDVITEINDQRLTSSEDFKNIVNGFSPGQAIELTVWHRERDPSNETDSIYRKKTVNVTIENLSQ